MSRKESILHILPSEYGGGVEKAARSFLHYSCKKFKFSDFFSRKEIYKELDKNIFYIFYKNTENQTKYSFDISLEKQYSYSYLQINQLQV